MKRMIVFLSIVQILTYGNLSNAYDQGTHLLLTERAVLRSTLPSRLGDFGLTGVDDPIDSYTLKGRVWVVLFCIPRLFQSQVTVMATVQLGAFCEDMTIGDDQSFRYVNHFYDPAHGGLGLNLPPFPRFDSSLAWARNDGNHPLQTFAYRDVKSNLEQSVIAASATDRKRARAKFFRSVGHLAHLVQDIGQPQHTREDPHGAGSPYESYVDQNIDALLRINAPAIESYPIVGVTQLSDLWSTVAANNPQDGKGLADYTNSQFVTLGRNFRGTPQNIVGNDYELYPTGEGAIVGNPVAANTLDCGNDDPINPTTGLVQFISLPVSDKFRNTTTTNPTATMFSIFARDLASRVPGFTGKGGFTVNDCTYPSMAQLTLPAAVGFSAGLIDYAMRGQILISPSNAGIYGIVDHARFSPSQPNYQPTNVDFGFKGFNKIKVRLANTTSSLISSGGQVIAQDMPAGTLTAVLKFHRNHCYNDLLTDWPATGAAAKQECRLENEEIVTSLPLDAQSIPFQFPAEPAGSEFEFDFSGRELPINAWDVVLQIVYRGQLGLESDAVVVATKDISEPSFISFLNATDQVAIDGHVHTVADANANQALLNNVKPDCVDEMRTHITSNCFDTNASFSYAVGGSSTRIDASGATTILPRHFARLAFLSEVENGIGLYAVPNPGDCSDQAPLILPGLRAQLYQGQFAFGLATVIRGINHWNSDICLADIGSVPNANLPLGEISVVIDPAEVAPVPLSIVGW